MGEGYTQTKYVFEFPIVQDPLSVGVHVEALWINGRIRQETIPKAVASTDSVPFHSVDWPHSADDPAYLSYPPTTHA